MYVWHIRYRTCLLIAAIKKRCHSCWGTSRSGRNVFDCNDAAVRPWPIRGKVASVTVCDLGVQQRMVCDRQDDFIL